MKLITLGSGRVLMGIVQLQSVIINNEKNAHSVHSSKSISGISLQVQDLQCSQYEDFTFWLLGWLAASVKCDNYAVVVTISSA